MNGFAPVASLPVYKKLFTEGLLGGYHLLIATEVVKDKVGWGDFWSGFFNENPEAPIEPPFIMMDNGLIETGQPCSADVMFEAASAVDADCIVLPDKLGDMRATMALVDDSAYWELDYPYLGVIQGQNLEEVDRIVAFYREIGVGYVSIPRVMVEFFGTRRHLIERVRHALPNTPIHLLGFSDDVNDDMMCAAQTGVLGIDSATPIWYDGAFPPSPTSVKRNLGRRPKTYWTDAASPWASDNIRRVREWIGVYVKAARLAEGLPEAEDPKTRRSAL